MESLDGADLLAICVGMTEFTFAVTATNSFFRRGSCSLRLVERAISAHDDVPCFVEYVGTAGKEPAMFVAHQVAVLAGHGAVVARSRIPALGFGFRGAWVNVEEVGHSAP